MSANNKGIAAFLIAAFSCILLSATAYLGGMHYVVIGESAIGVIRKPHFTLWPVVVDTRSWSVLDVMANHEIVALCIAQGQMHLVPGGREAEVLLAYGEAGLHVAADLAEQGIAAAELSVEEFAGFVERSGESWRQIDERYEVSRTAREIGRATTATVDSLAERYDIAERAERAKEQAEEMANRFRSFLKD